MLHGDDAQQSVEALLAAEQARLAALSEDLAETRA